MKLEEQASVWLRCNRNQARCKLAERATALLDANLYNAIGWTSYETLFEGKVLRVAGTNSTGQSLDAHSSLTAEIQIVLNHSTIRNRPTSLDRLCTLNDVFYYEWKTSGKYVSFSVWSQLKSTYRATMCFHDLILRWLLSSSSNAITFKLLRIILQECCSFEHTATTSVSINVISLNKWRLKFP